MKNLATGIVIGVLAAMSLGQAGKPQSAGRYSIAGGNGAYMVIDNTSGQMFLVGVENVVNQIGPHQKAFPIVKLPQ